MCSALCPLPSYIVPYVMWMALKHSVDPQTKGTLPLGTVPMGLAHLPIPQGDIVVQGRLAKLQVHWLLGVPQRGSVTDMGLLFFWQNIQHWDSISEFTPLASLQSWGAQSSRLLAAQCSSPSGRVVCSRWESEEYPVLPPHPGLPHRARYGCCRSSLEMPT